MILAQESQSDECNPHIAYNPSSFTCYPHEREREREREVYLTVIQCIQRLTVVTQLCMH
jgi:hypothetical protein